VSRPSEPVLRWLRRQIDAKGENTASIAAKLGRPRQELRKVLSGAEPMLVDDLLAITEMLGLSPEEMGLPDTLPAEVLEQQLQGEDSDHWGNQPRLLVQLGFDAGIDMLLLVDTSALAEGWGGPAAVLRQHAGKQLPLQLLAAYHQHMRPELSDEELSIVLSFDTLYTCRLPWHAIRRIVFDPLAPEAPKPKVEAPAEKPAGAPFLRLVT
jgi:hypothetical protein